MACVKCQDICNCLTLQSSDANMLIERTESTSGCIFTFSLLKDPNEAVPYYLTFDNNTRNLCVKDNDGVILNCVTIPSNNDPQILSLNDNILSISDGNSVTLPTMPIISVMSGSLDVMQGGQYGQNINIELTPSSDAGNALRMGSDGKPYASTDSQIVNIPMVVVESSKGIFFQNNGVDTSLTALVYLNGEDITSTMPNSAFSWHRRSLDASADAIWDSNHIGVGNTITLTGSDVTGSDTFNCTVTINI